MQIQYNIFVVAMQQLLKKAFASFSCMMDDIDADYVQ